jgi:hypothetical protein
MTNHNSLRDEPQFRKCQYMSQCLILGGWNFLAYHATVKQARKRLGDLGARGRVLRMKMEVVLPNEVR